LFIKAFFIFIFFMAGAHLLLVSHPLFVSQALAADIYSAGEKIVIYGEYPVVTELGRGRFQNEPSDNKKLLIDYEQGSDFKEKALREALHLLSANVYGYTFSYKPGSMLMKTEEEFEIALKGRIGRESATQIGGGAYNTVYRVKLEFLLTPSAVRWMNAFRSNTLRAVEAEGTSDFYAGWEGRNDALWEALRNLVLVAAKKKLYSKPLVMEGDILLDGNPVFSVGAGRHYCRINGYVNLTKVVTYD